VQFFSTLEKRLRRMRKKTSTMRRMRMKRRKTMIRMKGNLHQLAHVKLLIPRMPSNNRTANSSKGNLPNSKKCQDTSTISSSYNMLWAASKHLSI